MEILGRLDPRVALKSVVGAVNTFFAERQKVREERLRAQFLSDQAFFQALGLEELLRGILRGKENSFIWSTPIFTPAHPEFFGFARININRLVDPYVVPSLPNDKPVQAFEEVRIEVDGTEGIVMIHAAKYDDLEEKEWIDRDVLVSRFAEACKNPSKRLVRYVDFLVGGDAYTNLP